MRTQAIAFICSVLVTGSLVPVITRFARRRGLFDHITSLRKVHSGRVPRLGGIAIVAGFYAPLLGLILYPTGLGSLFYADGARTFAFMFGGLAIAGLGIFDDIFGCGAVEKFVVQVGVAAYMWFAGFRIEDIRLIGDSVISLGTVGGAALTLVWIVGVMNALNLIDGLDGLAAGVALASALTNLVISAIGHQPLMGLWMMSLAGALVAFLRFNFHPATIFMGDGGSLFLGYVLAVTSIRTSQKSSSAVSLLVPIVALCLPIADTLLAMLRRKLRGRPMFSGDKEHIHHRLLALGLSHSQVVLVLYAVAACLGATAIAIVTLPLQVRLYTLGIFSIGIALGLWWLGFFRFKENEEIRRQNAPLRSAVKEMVENVKRADSMVDITRSIADLAPAMKAHSVRLQLRGSSALPGLVPAPRDVIQPAASARFPIEPDLGHLLVEWTDAEEGPHLDHEIAAASVTKALSQALERAMPGALLHDAAGPSVVTDKLFVRSVREAANSPPTVVRSIARSVGLENET